MAKQKAHESGQIAADEQAENGRPSPRAEGRKATVEAFGWTREEAAEIRASLASFAEDWDDPAMDVYDAL
jgi:hypothetical protein